MDDYEQYMREQGQEGVAVVEKCTRIAEAVSKAIDALAEIHMCMRIYDIDEVPEEEPEAIAATA
ncbi:MAG: hypothetical protein IJF90_12190 [Synergistaceae bacterium]|nr:hypothetical protein [Synergistaceae bacterium]MBQ3758007.1 hypothetical protein [Synergistaceae bacterium]MBQ4401776.1 hypothetical protein [Synergistaceae bacterium]